MQRTFGIQTLTGVAQPIFGDVTTAAVLLPLKEQDALITVANTAIYQVGDRILLEPGTTNQDSYKVSVIKSSTVLQCSLEGATGHAHASGVTIAISIACSELTIQAVYGTTGSIWVGADKTITSAGAGSAVFQVTPNLPFHKYPAGANNSINTAEYWMAATAAIQGIVSATQV